MLPTFLGIDDPGKQNAQKCSAICSNSEMTETEKEEKASSGIQNSETDENLEQIRIHSNLHEEN